MAGIDQLLGAAGELGHGVIAGGHQLAGGALHAAGHALAAFDPGPAAQAAAVAAAAALAGLNLGGPLQQPPAANGAADDSGDSDGDVPEAVPVGAAAAGAVVVEGKPYIDGQPFRQKVSAITEPVLEQIRTVVKQVKAFGAGKRKRGSERSMKAESALLTMHLRRQQLLRCVG